MHWRIKTKLNETFLFNRFTEFNQENNNFSVFFPFKILLIIFSRMICVLYSCQLNF